MFVRDKTQAATRAYIIYLILRDIQKKSLLRKLGKCLDVGCDAGQGSYALKKCGATEVYGIDSDAQSINFGLEIGFLNGSYAINSKLENIQLDYDKGLLGITPFDTVTSFCFPYLPLEKENEKENEFQELYNQYNKLLTTFPQLSDLKVEIPNFEKQRIERRILHPLEKMISILSEEGQIIISTYHHDYLPEIFKRFGLNCLQYMVPEKLGPERAVFVGYK